MIIVDTKDPELIKTVLCDPGIYERVNDDYSVPVQEFEPRFVPGIQYIAGFVDNAIIGLMVYTYHHSGIKCHLSVLPKYRQKYARKFARMVFKFGKAKNASIYAEIPTLFPEVIRFAKDLDFKVVGKIEKGRKKFGKFYDLIILRLHNERSS